MKEDVTDALLSAIRARCVCRGNCRYGMSTQHGSKARALRSVPNCGNLVQTRNRDDELSDMAFYARNIRAFRTGEIDHAPNRPKLTLVRSRDTIETSRTTT